MKEHITTEKLKSEIAQCMGGEEGYHRLTLLPINCTAGIKMVADLAQAYWLFDAIASYQVEKRIKEIPFQIWTLEVKSDDDIKSGVLTMKQDTNSVIDVEQNIGATDFPVGIWKFYLTDNVLMLPKEY